MVGRGGSLWEREREGERVTERGRESVCEREREIELGRAKEGVRVS